MNDRLRNLIGNVNRFTIKSSAKIIDNKFVLKDRKIDNLDRVYGYLKSRSFDYFPEPMYIDSDYEVYPYIEELYEPTEQKALDMMHLLTLLHSKTTFYREVDIDRNKEIYEDITEKLNYLNNFYSDLITMIEGEVYMSPSSYLIARNINLIFDSIYYARDGIDSWYKKIENNKNERVSYIHNNINLDHYIKSDKPYLISWNNSRIDKSIYDLLSFYKNHYLDLDFSEMLHYYENYYPLKEEERLLLFVYMAIPFKIEFIDNEYEMCIKINKMIEYLYKTSYLIKNYQGTNR